VIVQSLVRYYDILAADKSVKISKWGYSHAKVSFALVISKDGDLTNIIDLRTDEKKKQPKIFEVPYQKSRTVAVTPYFACDNAKYIFGIDKINDDKAQSSDEIIETLEVTGKEKIVVSKRSMDCFEQFRILHHSLLNNIEDESVQLFLKFLDTWKPASALNCSKIREYKDEIFASRLFIFDLGGKYLHLFPEVKGMWESQFSSDEKEGEEKKDNEKYMSQCLVTGAIAPIAKTHQKIRGVFNPQGQITETSLVSFNKDAFWSYGKKQSYNAPISEVAMFKYTTALNHLLERGSKNRISIGDTTTVFWAETTNKICENLTLFFIAPAETPDEPSETKEGTKKQDLQTRQLVSDILQKVRTGQHLEEKELGVDPDTTKFYILGLSPNNARLAVRFWYEDNFGNFITRVARHHLDMEIERDDGGPQVIPVYLLLKQTVPQNSRDNAASPLIGGLLMRSILEGTPYPVPMYSAILNRVKVEHSINYARAGFIKACLIRLTRTRGKHEEDMITVSLNEESTSVPYRLGRLFAVLEKAQSDTNKELKSTITSKYFSSASTTPAIVFPALLKLAQHHITKSDWGFKSNQKIEEIMSGIDGFPAFLTLEEQGMFMLGYYHQRKANYPKKLNNEEKTNLEKGE